MQNAPMVTTAPTADRIAAGIAPPGNTATNSAASVLVNSALQAGRVPSVTKVTGKCNH